MQNRHSLLRKLLLWIGAAALALLSIITVLEIYVFAENDDFNSPYHPFKSKQAKEAYLRFYDERAKKWPVLSTTRIIPTSYGKTFVRISGPENAPALLLLHGGGGNALQWIPNVEALSQHYRVFAIDIIYDNGRSIHTKVMRSSDDYVHWLNEVLDACASGEPVDIVGLSYGGWITAHYALQFPQRLGKIVLLAPAGTVLPFSTEWIVRATPLLFPIRYFTREFMYWLAEDSINSGLQGRAVIDEYIDEKLMTVRSFKPKKMATPDVLSDEELQNLTMPTLFMIGENEKTYSAHDAIARLHRVAPQIETKLIVHAGHDMTIVQHETVNKAIVAFLTQAPE